MSSIYPDVPQWDWAKLGLTAPACTDRITALDCARCGQTHPDIGVYQLAQAFDDGEAVAAVPTHYAICPVTWQPILVWVIDAE
jgi:hypothetical protein